MKGKIVLSVVAVGIGIVAASVGFRAWKSLNQPVPQLESPRQEFPDIAGSFYLKNVPRLEDVHLLDGDFKIVRRMNEIPGACVSIFDSAFVTINGVHAKPGEVRFANPGEAFNWSDNIHEDLPMRRLEFAGLSSSGCFIHYQSGGQPNSFCLAVIDIANHRLAVGECERAAKDVQQLRRLTHRRMFRDGRGC